MIRRAGVHKKGQFSLFDLLKSVESSPNFRRVGALAIFVGVVRGETPSGENVKKLELEAYEEKANETLENICKELQKRTGVIDVQIHHLIGEFNVGEDLVYVLVAGSHRHNVFPVLEEAVERYKKEAPIFKKEYITTKEGLTKFYWVSERYAVNSQKDYRALKENKECPRSLRRGGLAESHRLDIGENQRVRNRH